MQPNKGLAPLVYSCFPSIKLTRKSVQVLLMLEIIIVARNGCFFSGNIYSR